MPRKHETWVTIQLAKKEKLVDSPYFLATAKYPIDIDARFPLYTLQHEPVVLKAAPEGIKLVSC